MEVVFHTKGLKEFNALEKPVTDRFLEIFNLVKIQADPPKRIEKKIAGTDLVEYRVKHNTNIYRAIAGIIKPNIIILVVFQKKTQKTPRRILKTARQRLNSLN